mgnify:CR=1 FL=1
MIQKIKLSDYFGKMIITRNAVADFFSFLSQLSEKEIILDFKEIEFISRSCADEYIKRKLMSNKQIKEINISHNIYSMFLLVVKQNSLNAKIIINLLESHSK